MATESEIARVSVVVTNYNHERFLWSALESLAAQTQPPFEVILIDDGSFELPDAALVFKMLPQATVLFAPHRGVGAALNAAIALMRGDVFCWLPADDLWKPKKLERQAKFADQNCGCILHSFSDIWEDNTFKEVGQVPEMTDEEFARAIRMSSPYFGNTFWIPKPILDLVGPFREDVPASEDYQWVLRSVIQNGVKYRLQKESLTVKRKHANTMAEKYAAQVPSLMEQFNSELS